ncbi:MAG: amidohydrolase family protein [Bacteroidales bacterium]
MIHNCHIHTFRDIDVPVRFLPFGLVRLIASQSAARTLIKVLNHINPFSSNDLFERYARFVRVGKLGSQRRILEQCMKHYPEDTRFVILAMDLAFMEAGTVPRPYPEQLRELAELKATYPQVIPFIHIDPRRPGHLDLLRQAAGEWGFGGVKIYPPIGYFPYDERLYPVYDFCQGNNLPVITHCSPFNPVHFRGNRKELLSLLSNARIPLPAPKASKKILCSTFSHPANWEQVAADFPQLRICLAHFGSGYWWTRYLDEPVEPGNWLTIIRRMIESHGNVYTDVSFTMSDTGYFSLLKVLLANEHLRSRVLFGSDFYMVETEAPERRFGLDLRAFIGEENFRAIATDNPVRFLSGH